MNLVKNKLYINDVDYVCNINFPWDQLDGCSILISGATGLIGSFLIDVIIRKNINCTIYAVSRNIKRMKARFSAYEDISHLILVGHDVKEPLVIDKDKVDYVFHLASNTHPIQYATDPIGTITTNIIGLKNMLDFSVTHNTVRFIFASSNEIYGENRGDVELFDESYCGYIDSNTLRAGYPESKRCGEALCQSYIQQMKSDIVIPRFTRSYGPTMLMSDTKAINQFILKAMKFEDIILKSKGNQYYSYTYVADAVSGLLYLFFWGISGEAYNIAHIDSDIKLCDMAALLAQMCGTNVVYDIPDAIEASGYSKASKARLDGNKIQKLGWAPRYDINSGLVHTLRILRDVYG